jgi:hypothetical protein
MLTLVIALISCLGVVVASIVNYRAITAAARITAADPARFDTVLLATLAELEVAHLQHDSAIDSADPGQRDPSGRAAGARRRLTALGDIASG